MSLRYATNSSICSTSKKKAGDLDIAYYTSFDDFIKHDMDAVVLANYANEHAPFAIRCLDAGLHVFSEVLPAQTMKEAVELIEAVERSGKVYSYGENYCYMPANREMKKLYDEGKIGEFERCSGTQFDEHIAKVVVEMIKSGKLKPYTAENTYLGSDGKTHRMRKDDPENK